MSHNLALCKTSQQTLATSLPMNPTAAKPQTTIAMPSQPIEAPSAWMHNGTSPAEFLLASSFLLISQSVIIWSIAGLIHALKNRK
jgi:hypothetical protein